MAQISLDKSATWKMFDRIAKSYDFLNRILSLGIDVRWRKKVASFISKKQLPLDLLDLGTGTGDFIFTLIQELKMTSFTSVKGIDLSKNMLSIAQKKADTLGLASSVSFDLGDATKVDVKSGSFDVITMAFAIRNVTDPSLTLSEMVRILRPNGHAYILEFSLPKNSLIKGVYLGYFRFVLPFLGGIISGDKQAYSYLNKSVEEFPYGQDFLDLMTESGFDQVTAIPLTFGIATLYIGHKYPVDQGLGS